MEPERYTQRRGRWEIYQLAFQAETAACGLTPADLAAVRRDIGALQDEGLSALGEGAGALLEGAPDPVQAGRELKALAWWIALEDPEVMEPPAPACSAALRQVLLRAWLSGAAHAQAARMLLYADAKARAYRRVRLLLERL